MPKINQTEPDRDDPMLELHDLLVLAADAQENPSCTQSRLEALSYLAQATALSGGILGQPHV